MQKLAEVENAKAVMTEGRDWSVLKWLREKKRVRKLADTANDALDALEKEVKASWSDDLRAAYEELADKGASGKKNPSKPNALANIDPSIRQLVQRVKEADDRAYRAHMDAEDTFDRAERILSTSLAREGSKKAIESWDLHEHAIRLAENVVRNRSIKE